MQGHDGSIGMGIVGFGTAGRSFLPAIRRHPGFELVAVADCVEAVRDEIARDNGVAAYADLTGLLAHPGLQELYGRTYRDNHLANGLSMSIGWFGDAPGRLWSSIRRSPRP